jgi:hypothetical protein
MVDKIRDLFEKMESPAVVILQTPRAGEEVDNGCGVDFDLAPYAVIYDNVENYYKHSRTKYDFEMENHTDIMTFDSAGCTPDVDALVQQLNEMDGYEVKWRRDESNKATIHS